MRRRRRELLDLQAQAPLHLSSACASSRCTVSISVRGAHHAEALPQREQDDADQRARRSASSATARAGGAWSSSRTIGLLRTSILMACSKSIGQAPSANCVSDMTRRSAARSLALRARGLPLDFVVAGDLGALRQHADHARPRDRAPRSVCLTMRSSRQWNAITTRRAPARSRSTASRTKLLEPVELAVDPDPQRLERARRRIDALIAAVRHGAADHLRERRPSSSAAPRRGPGPAPARSAANAALRRTGRSRWPGLPRSRHAAGRPPSAPGCDPSACRAARRRGS